MLLLFSTDQGRNWPLVETILELQGALRLSVPRTMASTGTSVGMREQAGKQEPDDLTIMTGRPI